MKRLFILSIGVLVSGVLGLQLGHMTFAVSSSNDLLGEIFSNAELEETDTKDSKELNALAANDEAPFNNLYLFMFQNVSKGPSDAALEEIQNHFKEKKRRDYTTDELRSIVIEGSLEPIIEKLKKVASEVASDPNYLNEQDERIAAQTQEYEDFKSSNSFGDTVGAFYEWYYQGYVAGDVLTKEDTLASVPQKNILDEYNYLVDVYQNELELQREYRKFSYESIADEMFFNNDLSDSADIDILNDLDQAHLVIFGNYITYQDRSGTDAVSLASEQDFVSERPGTLESGEEDVPVAIEPDSTVVLSSDAVNPYTCFDDDSLHSALDDFYNTDTDETQLNLPESIINYPSLGDDDIIDPDPETESPQEAVDNGLKELDGFINELQSTQGDWTRSLPCSDIFCITVNLVSDTEDPVMDNNYLKTDNCVLCHLSYINKRMSETLDKSLVASKPSQNWFEDATCKEAGSKVSLDLNVYTIPMPIDLDPGDDTDDIPAKSVEDLKKTLSGIGALPDSTTEDFGKTLADMECESILNLATVAGTPVTIDSAQESCVEAANVIQAQVDEAYDSLLFESAIGNGNTLYEQAAGELYSMLLLFRNIQNGLKATYIQDVAPLSRLIAKPYCK